jgi:hypothetical protein
MAMLSVEQYSPADRLSAERVLTKLQRLDARTAVHSGRRLRQYDRKCVNCMLEIRPVPKHLDTRSSFLVWSFDISQSGLGFIAPGEIRETQLCIGIPIPGNTGQSNWFLTDVVRKRRVPEEHFWEYGVVIVARVDSPESVLETAEPAS